MTCALHVGNVLFTRVVTVAGGSILIGACPWVIPVERLTPLATLRGDVHIADEVRDGAGTLMACTLTSIRAGNFKRKDWENTTLETVGTHMKALCASTA